MRRKRKELNFAAWYELRQDDDGQPYWYGYHEGDKDGDRNADGEPLSISTSCWPVGTRVEISEPDDPQFYERLWNDRAEQFGLPKMPLTPEDPAG